MSTSAKASIGQPGDLAVALVAGLLLTTIGLHLLCVCLCLFSE